MTKDTRTMTDHRTRRPIRGIVFLIVAALFAVTVVQQYQVDTGSGWDAVWKFAVLPLMALVGLLTAVFGIVDLYGRSTTNERP